MVRVLAGDGLHRLGELEVQGREAPGIVGRERHPDLVPGVAPVRVVIDALGDEGDLRHEGEGLDEVLELEVAPQLRTRARPVRELGHAFLLLRFIEELGCRHVLRVRRARCRENGPTGIETVGVALLLSISNTTSVGGNASLARHESVFRFLYRLSADVHALTRDDFMRRLVTGLANHYGATSCKVLIGGHSKPIAASDEDGRLAQLTDEDRWKIGKMEHLLLQASMEKGELASVGDIPRGSAHLYEFLEEKLGLSHVFAFPLVVNKRPRGAIILHLPEDARALAEGDVQALLAIGEILHVMDERVPKS